MYICINNSCLSSCFERVKLIADLAKYIRASAKSRVFLGRKSENIYIQTLGTDCGLIAHMNIQEEWLREDRV